MAANPIGSCCKKIENSIYRAKISLVIIDEKRVTLNQQIYRHRKNSQDCLTAGQAQLFTMDADEIRENLSHLTISIDKIFNEVNQIRFTVYTTANLPVFYRGISDRLWENWSEISWKHAALESIYSVTMFVLQGLSPISRLGDVISRCI